MADTESQARTLTLLFTDVERSTEIIDRHGEAGTEALLRHHAIVREVVAMHGGDLFEQIGDATYSVFTDAADAADSAVEIHRRLASEAWGPIGRLRVRVAIDTGELRERNGRYLGRALYRCSRIQGMAGGGETLLSGPTADALGSAIPPGHRLRALGRQRLRGLRETEDVWALVPGPAGASERPIRVLLVDDYEVVRRGLRSLIELQPDMEVAGEASSGGEALEEAHRLLPDVILMDLVMPAPDGIAVTRQLHGTNPEIAVVALTSFTEPERLQLAVEAGATGHLFKDAAGEEVLAAIRAAAGMRPA